MTATSGYQEEDKEKIVSLLDLYWSLFAFSLKFSDLSGFQVFSMHCLPDLEYL